MWLCHATQTVQTMMASLVEEGRPLEFALWQAIQWGPGCSNFEGTTDQDENEAQCNAVKGCAWQSQGEVPRYFAGGQEQWYLEHAYSRDNNGDFPPAGTDLSQFDLRYMYVKAGQSLDDVDDSASRGCLPENYTQQLAQIGKRLPARICVSAACAQLRVRCSLLTAPTSFKTRPTHFCFPFRLRCRHLFLPPTRLFKH